MSEEREKEGHICPLLMRTVVWIDGKCAEQCDKMKCPLRD